MQDLPLVCSQHCVHYTSGPWLNRVQRLELHVLALGVLFSASTVYHSQVLMLGARLAALANLHVLCVPLEVACMRMHCKDGHGVPFYVMDK
jgi:hypothetical protein